MLEFQTRSGNRILERRLPTILPTIQLQVLNVACENGATVEVFADAISLGSAVCAGGTVAITPNEHRRVQLIV